MSEAAQLPRRLSRRGVVLGATLLPVLAVLGTALPRGAAQASAEAVEEAIREMLGGTSPAQGDGLIHIDLPQVAEDGSSVPLTVSVDGPLPDGSRVESLHVFAERNPHPKVVSYRLSPMVARAEVSTRIRLAESQRVHVLAQLSDGSAWRSSREVVVTIGGCS